MDRFCEADKKTPIPAPEHASIFSQIISVFVQPDVTGVPICSNLEVLNVESCERLTRGMQSNLALTKLTSCGLFLAMLLGVTSFQKLYKGTVGVYKY